MKLLVQLMIGLPFVLGGAALLNPDLILGDELLNRVGFWTIVGTTFSYFGFVFSLFAVLEVKALSNRYFAKQRLPEIKKRIDSITKDVLEFAESQLIEIRSQRFMSEIAVMTRQVKKTKVSDLSTVTKAVEESHDELLKHLEAGFELKIAANGSDKFWALFRSLTELADEIGEYNKGAIASL